MDKKTYSIIIQNLFISFSSYLFVFPSLYRLRLCLFEEAFITSPHNRKKSRVTASPLLQEFQSRFHYTFRGLLILESKTYANEAAAWFYKARNFERRHLFPTRVNSRVFVGGLLPPPLRVYIACFYIASSQDIACHIHTTTQAIQYKIYALHFIKGSFLLYLSFFLHFLLETTSD